MLPPILISVTVFLAVILFCIVAYKFWETKKDLKLQSQRLDQAIAGEYKDYKEAGEQNTSGGEEDLSVRRDTRISSIPWLNTFLEKYLKEKSKVLMNMIEQSGLKIKVSELVLMVGLLAFIGEMAVDLFSHIPFVGLIVGMLPFPVLNTLKTKRVDKFVLQLPQALDMLCGDLRAGLDIQTGLKHLSTEFPAPLGEEFGKVVVEINLGLTLQEALVHLSSRINTMDVQMLCTGIIINRELGGNLSELIGSISNTVRERFRLKGMIKALTAENQMSAMLLMILPVGLYILLTFMSPDLYSSFSQDPLGQKILVGCAVSMGIGYAMIQKITKLEV